MNRNERQEDLKRCLSCIDLTTLKSTDTIGSVRTFTEQINDLHNRRADLPLPASVCVFPNFASTVRSSLRVPDTHVTVVSGCFPASQSFLEVKLLETRMALEDGADEVDIVLALNAFLDGNYEACSTEIRTIRKLCSDWSLSAGKNITLKVILETGVLQTEEKIRKAAFLAMEAGADFIKTSTGKTETGATPQAAEIMCRCILEYATETGRKVGFKAAGGIAVAEDALIYHDIVKDILGSAWLNPSLFRIGASRLLGHIISCL